MPSHKENITQFINTEITQMPISLNSELTKNGNKINTRDEVNKFKNYINEFLDGYEFNRYNILPGIRGVGKTTILYQIYDYLLNEKKIPQNQILYTSCEDLNNLVKCNIRELTETFLETIHETTTRLLDKKIFLLIDEVNYDPQWAISGKILYDRNKNIFMIFTGSSALNFEYNADSARRLNKEIITPLNYREHIKLKYNLNFTNLSQALEKLILTGETENAIKYEQKTKNILKNTKNYTNKEWNTYLKYGGFPEIIYTKNHKNISKRLIDISKKIIYIDMPNIKNFTRENQTNANRIIRFLALQNSGETSQTKLSNSLNTAKSNIKNIIDILEKTHLIFHIEQYGTINKRNRGTWKYYFATSSIKNALATERGNTIKKIEQYGGLLLENFTASTIFNFSLKKYNSFNLYNDGNKKNNVDFILSNDFEKPIPIEVGRGKKDKKQIKNAINNYDAEYGIVISNKEDKIKKEDNVIFMPAVTFSFL